MKIFETTVIAIGQDAEEFKQENMLLFFGEEAPPELSDFCYKIMVTPIQERIVPDMVLCFNNERYAITAVGKGAEENLRQLGHITVNFDGAAISELPGTIHVEQKPLPTINVGDLVSIIRT